MASESPKVYRRVLKPCPCEIEKPMEVDKFSRTWVEDKARHMPGATLLAYASDGIIWGKVEDGTIVLAPSSSELNREGNGQVAEGTNGRVAEGTALGGHGTALGGHGPAPGDLDDSHLQELWLFNQQEAWHLWKEDNPWRALHFSPEREGEPCREKGKEEKGEEEKELKPCCYYDEPYLLWGTTYKKPQDEKLREQGFTQVSEGERGLHQAIPLKVDESAFREGEHPLCLWVRHYLKEDEYGVLRVFLSRPLCLAVGERCRPDDKVKCEQKGGQA